MTILLSRASTQRSLLERLLEAPAVPVSILSDIPGDER